MAISDSRDSTKHDKFVRIAEARVNKAIRMIRLLGNLSNPAVYEYTDKEVRKIFNTVEQELKQAKGRFQGKNEDTFSLR